MKDGFIKVAAGTPKIRLADPLYNAGQIVRLMKKAEGLGVKLLCFPELCLTGYTCGDLFSQGALLQGAQEALGLLLRETAELEVLTALGMPIECDNKLYNCAAVIQKGVLLGLVPKTAIPNYGEFYEGRWFTPAPMEPRWPVVLGEPVRMGRQVFVCQEVPNLKVGVELCEDLWGVEPPSNALCRQGATVILNLSASDETVGKADYRRSLVTGQSARCLCGYVYADAGEGESTADLVFRGHDIIAENGAVLAQGFCCQDLAVSEVDVDKLAGERRRMNTFLPMPAEHTVPFHLTVGETVLTRPTEKNPFVPADDAHQARRCEEVLTLAALGLKHRLEHTGDPRPVIGLSGGLDSTLALLITCRAMALSGRGTEDVVAVTMPCFGTTARTRSNAEVLARRLGAELRTVDIGKAVEQHFRDIGQDPNCHDVTFENAQARERTQVLMDIANQCGGLVIGTGDLSELALGWCTYNGDQMSMYAVNASIPKTLVRYVVDYAARTADDPALAAVLRDILATPVSPELLPGEDGEIAQKTEDLVGPYELHDFFLYHILRWGFPPRKVLRLALGAFGGDYPAETVRKWLGVFYRRFFAQQFKRDPSPDGPKVGSVALSPRGDWRMPSDAQSALWLRELEEA